MIRPIVQIPERVLKTPAQTVGEIDDHVREVCRDLLDTMRSSPHSVGVAAPQIGVGLRIFCVDVTGHKKARSCHGEIVLINPEVLLAHGVDIGREGCMSVPDLTGDVARHTRLIVRGLTPEGDERVLQCDDAQLRSVQKLIQSLNPRPGASYAAVETRYIVPDVIVKKVKNVWVASLNPDAMPKLRVNRVYADLLQGMRNGSASAMSQQLQEARWLIKNVQQRFETIQRVSQAIVDRQRHFFEHGEVAMRPLVLREIAETLGLHESTVSRVTTQKFMATQRGIFELKYFFGSHVSTDTGGACSATAIRSSTPGGTWSFSFGLNTKPTVPLASPSRITRPTKRCSFTSFATSTNAWAIEIVALAMTVSGAMSLWSRFVPKAKAPCCFADWKTPTPAASAFCRMKSAPCAINASVAVRAAATSSKLPVYEVATTKLGFTLVAPASKPLKVDVMTGSLIPPTQPARPLFDIDAARIPAR